MPSGLEAFSLQGETALITGGGTGIGLGIATAFVHAGARVMLIGRRAEPLQKAAAALGPLATFEPHDITHVETAEPLIERLTQRLGPISILVNNAGIHLKKPAIETTPAEFQSVLHTHVTAAFALTRAILPGMIQRKHGNILFTASMASLFGIPNVLAYAAAKSAHLGLVRSLATEVSPYGVRVNAVAPGWIQSDMLDKAMAADPARKNKILDRTPMHRFGTPADIGHAATYLCSAAAQFVTGIILPIDGGASIGF